MPVAAQQVAVLPVARRPMDVSSFAARISAAWNKTRDGILEVGRLLVDAKGILPHGQFEAMVEKSLPFGARTARMLMTIADHPRIQDRKHVSDLPASWGTLYELTKLDDATFEQALARGIIRPDMDRKDLAPLLIEQRQKRNQATAPVDNSTCTVDDLGKLVTMGRRYGCIYADPPWRYDNQGTRAATGNHYDGMTVDEICELPVRDLAADDAHLHLWTTNAFLFDCPKIFAAWGFEFRSTFIWFKPQMGIGNYWRNSHEILLTAIRGDAKRFNDKSLKSWLAGDSGIICDRGVHSAKPEQVRTMIERASPPPFLEMFGRRQADRWTVWGNQINRDLLMQGVEAL